MAIKFGIIGTGYWAGAIHASGIKAVKGADLVGVWGRRPAQADAMAARLGVRAFHQLDDLLDAVDAVTVAVQPEAQPDLAIAAAQAGKHLILEKPLALDPETAHRINVAVLDQQSAALVFFLRRFAPEITVGIDAARGHAWDSAEISVMFAALSPGNPFANAKWRHVTNAALWDLGPHVLSIIRPLLGRVVSVSATPEEYGVCRMATTHESGARTSIAISLRADPNATCSSYRFYAPDRESVLPDVDLDRPAAFALAVKDLLEMIASGRRDHECDLRLGIEVTQVLAQAQKSCEIGRPLAVDYDHA